MEHSWLNPAMKSPLLIGLGPDSPFYAEFQEKIQENRRETLNSRSLFRSRNSKGKPYWRSEKRGNRVQNMSKAPEEPNAESTFRRLRKLIDSHELRIANHASGYMVTSISTSEIARVQQTSSETLGVIGDTIPPTLEALKVVPAGFEDPTEEKSDTALGLSSQDDFENRNAYDGVDSWHNSVDSTCLQFEQTRSIHFSPSIPTCFSPLCEKCGSVEDAPKGSVDLRYPQSSNESQDGPSLLLAASDVDLHPLFRPTGSSPNPKIALFYTCDIFVEWSSYLTSWWCSGCSGRRTNLQTSFLDGFASFWFNIQDMRIFRNLFFSWNIFFHIPHLVCSLAMRRHKFEAYPAEATHATVVSGAAWGRWEPPSLYEVFLSEKWCRLWLASQPTTPMVSRPEEEVKERLLEEVDINPMLQAATKIAIRTALEAAAISNFPGNITDASIKLELRAGYTPVSSAPRALGPAQTQLLSAWISEQVALGMYEKASPGCLWASCLHIAPTWKSQETPAGPAPKLEKIRVCGDYRAVNEQLIKVAQVVPLISDIKQKLAGFRCYARFDMTAGFNAISLEEGSRDVLAIRTPLGLFRPTRMPFGPKNNPSKYQKIVESLVNHLEGYCSKIFVYIDDILIGADDEDELTQMVQQVLVSVTRRGGTLKPKKIRIGYSSEVILGSEISFEGIRPSAAHVAAVQAIRLPSDPSEMRSVIGLFTYFFEHFPRFSERMAPLHRYSRNGCDFPKTLPSDVVSAIQAFKDEMKTQPLLVHYDPSRQLYIDSDSSLIAAGCCVYHKAPNGAREPIAYFSKKYTLAETRWAPYVREAYALTWALSKSKDFVQAAQDTPIVFIDQKPLLWLSSARSPKVVRWVVEILQELDYKLVYRPGPEHLGADAFSRVPCVSSGVPTDVGITVAIQRLLDVLVLPDRHAPRHVLWLSICGRDTELLQSLRQRNRKILVSATTTQALEATYDYAILIPDSTRAPVVARHLLRGIKPFAILLPTDLVHLTYSPLGGTDIETVDELARGRLRQTKKLVFMEDNLTWIVSPNWPGVFETAVYSVELFESSGGVAESTKRVMYYGMFFSPHVQRTLEAYVGDGLAEGLAPDLRRLRKPPTRDKILHAQRMDPTSIAWITQLDQGEKVNIQMVKSRKPLMVSWFFKALRT
jgi:hypothetical protein